MLSQASEGWTALPQIYDDGGISGGTLERPALQRLLVDIAARKIDIVVVYKVDRLTRSLFDFAKLVDEFDKAEVSFVSVTQSFNTTTSMGRLTLNMLLSFAQFEREVTAERIRDKIAASKAKGMWMGGVPPLGYAPDGRTLTIIPEQAALIRRIFERYLALGNVRRLAEELTNTRVRVPERRLVNGRAIGGGVFSRGQLYSILRSPLYAGDIGHRDKVYPGKHEAIIDREMWDAVQAQLTAQTQGERRAGPVANPSPLAGKVFDVDGHPLIASHASKGSRRYRYYISRPQDPGHGEPAVRIPAIELEQAVAACLAVALDEPLALVARLAVETSSKNIPGLFDRAGTLAGSLRARDKEALEELVVRVGVSEGMIEVDCDAAALAGRILPGASIEPGTVLTLTSVVQLQRSGLAMRLVHDSGATVSAALSPATIKLLLKAGRWWRILRTEDISIADLARREGASRSYMCRIVRLVFLAPAVVDAILAGNARAGVGARVISKARGVEPVWADQVARLLPECGALHTAGRKAGYGLRAASTTVSVS